MDIHVIRGSLCLSSPETGSQTPSPTWNYKHQQETGQCVRGLGNKKSNHGFDEEKFQSFWPKSFLWKLIFKLWLHSCLQIIHHNVFRVLQNIFNQMFPNDLWTENVFKSLTEVYQMLD